MSGERPSPNGTQRLARLIAKYRARRARRHARSEAPTETLEQFGQRVFGDETGQRIVLDYLREQTSWLESKSDDERTPAHGR